MPIMQSHMSSERQINANRINGAKSHGPVTPEGLLASSRNSVVHGLLSEAIILDGESAERFTALHDALIAEFEPQTPTECGLVETMVVCRWRLMRIWILENSAIAHEIRKQAGSGETENQPTQASFAYRTLSHDARGLDIFSRYETRYDRQLSRALQRFNEVRASREKKMYSPNEPNLSGKL
jgi:hypothetical protein